MSRFAYPPRTYLHFAGILEISCAASIDVIFKMHKQKANLEARIKAGLNPAARLPQITAESILRKTQGKPSLYRRAFEGTNFRNHADYEIEPKFQLELQLAMMSHFEKLHAHLIEEPAIALTRVNALVNCLAAHPIVSIRQLAESAIVSEATARRWLMKLRERGQVSMEFFGGQNQFLQTELIRLIDEFGQHALIHGCIGVKARG